jgi:tetratricopeptide (TPR) repeat protein
LALTDRELVSQTAAWVAASDLSSIDTGLGSDEALRRASELLGGLREGKFSVTSTEPEDQLIDVLHAACRILLVAETGTTEGALQDTQFLFDFISRLNWSSPQFDERDELLCSCAFAGWRSARQIRKSGVMAAWLKTLGEEASRNSETGFRMDQFLEDVRVVDEGESSRRLENPETLLASAAYLWRQLNTSPSNVRDKAELLYRLIGKAKRPVGPSEEHDYLFGEMALIAGAACRHLSRRDEARLWFDRAEAGFRHTINASADLSRLAYQRLAVRLEERQLEAVLELVPPLRESFERLGMSEDALKCRFLEGLALMESGRIADAVSVFQQVARTAEELGSDKLLALAYANLTQLHGILGDTKEAMDASERAIPILRRIEDRIGLAKVQWGIANLLREQGRIPAAIEAYRTAQGELERIGMRADVAALSLVMADLLLDTGQDQEALREILLALPVIDELKMGPEGVAMRSLLRESLRQQKINRQALRDLHGYFEENKT